MNTQAAATDMMIGALGSPLGQPKSGMWGSMLARNNVPNTATFVALRRWTVERSFSGF
jgi:hypothetical protein